MANIFKKIVEKLAPPKFDADGGKYDNGSDGGSGTLKPMNVQFLKDEIVKQFKEEMNNLTTKEGNSCMILYPMSFNILFNPNDFKLVGESFPFVLPMVLLGFYNAIRAKIEDAKKNGISYSYLPPAKSWFFQWAESSMKENADGQGQLLPRGEIFINSSLTKIEVTKDNIETIPTAGGTIRIVNSNPIPTNVNTEALGGATIGISKTSEWNFDSALPSDINDIRDTLRDKQNSLATLSYVDGRETKRYSMIDSQISISGSLDTRKLSSLFVINNDKIKNDIVRIQYLKNENKFQICAYGNVRVNESLLPISESGRYNWQDLSYKSKIFIVDANVQVTFNASESVIARVR